MITDQYPAGCTTSFYDTLAGDASDAHLDEVQGEARGCGTPRRGSWMSTIGFLVSVHDDFFLIGNDPIGHRVRAYDERNLKTVM
jgi:hypothetical protein